MAVLRIRRGEQLAPGYEWTADVEEDPRPSWKDLAVMAAVVVAIAAAMPAVTVAVLGGL